MWKFILQFEFKQCKFDMVVVKFRVEAGVKSKLESG